MQIKQDYIPINKYTRPGLKLKKVRGIVIHYTATPKATAKNERAYFAGTCIQQKRSASAHIFIDDNEAIQIMPLNEVAYHAHDRNRCFPNELKPNANLYTIGIEMCTDLKNDVTQKTQRNAEEIVAQLCKQFGLDPDTQIYRHTDITDKPCPKPFISKYGGSDQRFFDFKTNVKNIINGNQNNNKEMDFMAQFKELFDKELEDLRKKPVSSWAAKQWDESVTNGYFDGSAPQGFITRQEVAIVMNRLRHNIKDLVAEMNNRITELENKSK